MEGNLSGGLVGWYSWVMRRLRGRKGKRGEDFMYKFSNSFGNWGRKRRIGGGLGWIYGILGYIRRLGF